MTVRYLIFRNLLVISLVAVLWIVGLGVLGQLYAPLFFALPVAAAMLLLVNIRGSNRWLWMITLPFALVALLGLSLHPFQDDDSFLFWGLIVMQAPQYLAGWLVTAVVMKIASPWRRAQVPEPPDR